MLAITKQQFEKLYAGTTVLKYMDLFYTKPTSDVDILVNYLPSKLWRLNNIYTIVNKYGKLVRFKMNLSQHKVYAASLHHPRQIILKSRQQGISTMWLVSFFDDTMTNPNFSIGLMAQGADEASTLLERTKILWDNLDPTIKLYWNINISKDNTKEFSFTNGSNIFIRTSFRSTTLQRLHISEMGKIANKYPEKAQETKTGTLQAIAQGNLAVIESTAEGDNMFKDMWDNAIKYSGQLSKKDFFPVFLSWLDDPDCTLDIDQIISAKRAEYFDKLEKSLNIKLTKQQKNFWIVQYRELGDKIYQEYPSTPIEAFMATRNGSYYAELYLEWVKGMNREQANLYDKNLDVQVAVDLGMDDSMVLLLFQTYRDQIRILDEVVDNGKKISYYCNILKNKHYADNITKIILPHDAEVTDLTSGETRTEVFQREFPNAEVVVLPKTDRAEGIEQVRQIMSQLWIEPKCEYLISCCYNYSKEWDDKRSRFRDIPNHDEYSNGADALRYLAVGGERSTKVRLDIECKKIIKQRGTDI